MSIVESFFDEAAHDAGWNSGPISWPDRLVWRKLEDGKYEFMMVEVKGPTDYLRPEQSKSFELLKRFGFPIKIWAGGGMDDLIEVDQYKRGNRGQGLDKKQLSRQAAYNYRSEIKQILSTVKTFTSKDVRRVELIDRARYLNDRLPDDKKLTKDIQEAEDWTDEAKRARSIEFLEEQAKEERFRAEVAEFFGIKREKLTEVQVEKYRRLQNVTGSDDAKALREEVLKEAIIEEAPLIGKTPEQALADEKKRLQMYDDLQQPEVKD
jgi:hypothetical protein